MRQFNRRDGCRVRCDCQAEVRILTIPGQKKKSKIRMKCTTTDVSPNGARLSIFANEFMPDRGYSTQEEDILPPGTTAKLSITFNHPAKTFIHAGTLRWIKKEAGSRLLVMGFEFTHSKARTMKHWEKFLRAKIATADDLDPDGNTTSPHTVNVFVVK